MTSLRCSVLMRYDNGTAQLIAVTSLLYVTGKHHLPHAATHHLYIFTCPAPSHAINRHVSGSLGCGHVQVGPYLVVQSLVRQGLLGGAVPADPSAPPASLIVSLSTIVSSMTEPTVSASTKSGYGYRCSYRASAVASQDCCYLHQHQSGAVPSLLLCMHTSCVLLEAVLSASACLWRIDNVVAG
jgi:hypothetical protein